MSKLLSILKLKNRHILCRFLKGVIRETRHGLSNEMQCSACDVYDRPVYFTAVIDRTQILPTVTVHVKSDLIYYTVDLEELKTWLAIR